MPPETASTSWPAQVDAQADIRRVPDVWRRTFALLIAGALAVGALAFREWGEMFHQWWNIDTYTHILLVPVIIGWLVVLKTGELAKLTPRPWLPGLFMVAAGLALWAVGRGTGINLFAQAGAVGALQGVVIAAIGLRASLMLALPIAFGAFLIPFGDEIIPQLQAVTAEMTIALTHLSGIPASIDGIYIDTPIGLFIVAEACSGVRFLIAMVTLGVLVSFTRFDGWARRGLFMLACVIVPIVANGIRAWGTIFVAQSQGVEFAAGFDHIFYGWIFFALVVAIILAAAWRFFDREPEEYGWSEREVEALLSTANAERGTGSAVVTLAGVIALVVGAAIASSIVGPGSLV